MDTAPPPTALARHDAAPEIVVLNRDLFFGVRIGNALRDAGYAVTFRPATAAFAAAVRAAEPAAALGLIDLGADPDWSEIARLTQEVPSTPILVFGPHKDVDGFRAAKAAGITRIVSNGEFHRDMLGLVRRYARA
jgi:methylmalonyl-CoA mutase cobalamin-binding subunit